MKKNILMFLTAALAFTACYKEAPIERKVHDPAFTIEDSSDPGKHAIYDLYQKYGVAAFYEYDDVDYRWNMNSISGFEAKRIDPSFLKKGMDYLDDVLFSLYGADFNKKYMPFKIYLASEVSDSSAAYTTDVYATCVRSGMLVGKLREEALPADNATLKEATGWINASLWANYLIANDRVAIPEEFYNVSQEYYKQNALLKDHEVEDYLTVGIFDIDWSNTLTDGERYKMFPDQDMDLFQYIQRITTTSSEDMKAITKKYDKVKVKYNLLISAVKEATGVDLQAIGDKVAAQYPTEE